MIIDIVFLLPAIWLAWRGAKHGLMSEITSLAGLVLGLYVAVYFSDKVAGELSIQGSHAGLIAFGITFAVVMIVAILLGKTAEKLLETLFLGHVNKLLGALFGFLKAALIFSTLIFFLNSVDKHEIVLRSDLKNQSMFYKYLQPMAPMLYSRLKQSNGDAVLHR